MMASPASSSSSDGPAWVCCRRSDGVALRWSSRFATLYPEASETDIRALLFRHLPAHPFDPAEFLAFLHAGKRWVAPPVVWRGVHRWRVDSLPTDDPDKLPLLLSPPGLDSLYDGPDLAYLSTPDGQLIFAVPAVFDWLNDSAPTEGIDDLLLRIHPDDRERIRLELHLALSGKNCRPFPCRIKTREGWHWVSNVTHPVYDGEERQQAFAGLARDIRREVETTSNLTRRNMELVAIQELANAASGHDSPQEILKSVLRILRDHYPLDAVVLCFRASNLGKAGLCILDPDETGLGETWAADIASRPHGERMERFSLTPLPDHAPSWQQNLARRGIIHLATVPLRIRELGLGMLLLGSSQEETLADFSYPFLYTLRHHLVISLENTIRLQLERRKNQLANLLNDIASRLLESEDFFPIVDQLAQILPPLFPGASITLSFAGQTIEKPQRNNLPPRSREPFPDIPEFSANLEQIKQWTSDEVPLPKQAFRARLSPESGQDGWLLTSMGEQNFDELEREFLLQLSRHLLLAAERLRLRQELQIRKQAVEEKNNELQQYIYTISHDLKSPLFSIQGFVQILQEELPADTEEKIQQFLQRIQVNAQRMDTQIRELLTLSRLGARTIHPQTVPLSELMNECQLELQGRIQERQAIIHVDKLDLKLETDPELLQRAIVNLLDNAIKYVPDDRHPEIEIAGSCIVHRGKPGLRISIKDNGCGIAVEDQEKIFTIFQRLPQSRSVEGSGAGLTIVRRTMEKLQGRVWLESVPGCGSCFHLDLPLRWNSCEN